mmetsp:Transcript_22170/g.43111  ORF Transcript_22170/g.43111 Transcript_22170/m.43111 type:complete len:299 (-) Transcript_22170:293-1189(-)
MIDHEHPLDKVYPPPIIKFNEPEHRPGGKLRMVTEIFPEKYYERGTRDGFVAGMVHYSLDNLQGQYPLVKVHNIFVSPKYRRKGIALSMLNELALMHPKCVLQAEFSPDPHVQQDKSATYNLFGRFAVRGYPDLRIPDGKEEKYQMTVEVLLRNKGLKRRTIDARQASTMMPPLRAAKALQRIIVDTNVLDLRKLTHLKEPKNYNQWALPTYEDAKYDLTEMWRIQQPDFPDFDFSRHSKPPPPKRDRLGLKRPVFPDKDKIDFDELESVVNKGKKIRKRPKPRPTQEDLEVLDSWPD